ncbi:tyrosyl-DNA phosphodiesterase [Pestalotiopsis sp. NC0098]|nr:tyrosyl-DNA phosphodiesterase [Pestalotiopsis sp. NC0098]
MAEPPPKRQRIADAGDSPRPSPTSLTRPISPPMMRRSAVPRPQKEQSCKVIASPFRLTKIRDSPVSNDNDGAVGLHDLLGDPLIKECWEFNFLHDIDYLMSHFDQDVRSLVKVHLVHGFWKREDPNKIMLEQQASRHPNVALHTAYMPEIFGTHHSKMMILLRHDDKAQVIIHTANMIAKDWTNMTNGVWQSPLLPLLSSPDNGQAGGPVGSGGRFRADLLNYLRAYNTKRAVCKSLVKELAKYDFSDVRGSLIASVPGRHPTEHNPVTRWGWTAMKDALRSVPAQQGKSDVVVQVSSIATLGPTDTWLQKTLFDSLSITTQLNTRPNFKVVFPTADEIRRSLDGYASGGSIHTKIQSSQQQKQLQYLKPMFCHWANDSDFGIPSTGVSSNLGTHDAGRQRAAPHIKTYIRYNTKNTIDWALLTSANISKQAWGEAANAAKEVRIASWEIGVLVWPELFAEGQDAKMVATFKTDTPNQPGSEVNSDGESDAKAAVLVGLRIPYNLPLQKYGPKEEPWVATADYHEPDCKGNTW